MAGTQPPQVAGVGILGDQAVGPEGVPGGERGASELALGQREPAVPSPTPRAGEPQQGWTRQGGLSTPRPPDGAATREWTSGQTLENRRSQLTPGPWGN